MDKYKYQPERWRNISARKHLYPKGIICKGIHKQK